VKRSAAPVFRIYSAKGEILRLHEWDEILPYRTLTPPRQSAILWVQGVGMEPKKLKILRNLVAVEACDKGIDDTASHRMKSQRPHCPREISAV